MGKTSAGLLLYRRQHGELQVLLAHPGGPFWAGRDIGAWSIPKGEVATEEDALDAAKREFQEETGFAITGEFRPLTSARQKGGKVVHAWTVRGDCDPGRVRSNTVSLEWPPRSGRMEQFPEIDRAAWFPVGEALRRIVPGQAGFLHELVAFEGGPATARLP